MVVELTIFTPKTNNEINEQINEEQSINDQTNKETKLVGCLNVECDVLTSITISPTQKTLYSNKSFLCCYCSAILLNTITNEHSISHQGKKYSTQPIQTSIVEDVLEQSNINSLSIKSIDDPILSREAIQVGQKGKTSVEKQIQASVMESVHESSDINYFSITRSTDPILFRLDATSVLNSPIHNSPDLSGSRSNFNAGHSPRLFIQNNTSSYVKCSCDQPASSDIESMPKPESFVDQSENQRSSTPQN
ncbi:hypothetical protein GJ496_009876 [Pomphorhynchus laevis]|nr:hypothetical protein GJ496_009876 [Pomphorhynchus laevis]